MTLSDLDTRITFYTGQDSNNFTAAQRLVAINQAIDEIEALILRSQDDWEFDDSNQSNDPIQYINTVAGTQAYSLPSVDSNLVQLKRVDITFDGNKWDKCTEFNQEENTNASDTTSSNNYFFKGEPKYNVIGSKIYIYPIPDQTNSNAIKLVYGRLSVPFTTLQYGTYGSTYSLGFDRQFHDAAAIKASYDYCFVHSLNNTATLKAEWEAQKQKIVDWYSHKLKDKKYQLRARIPNYK